MSHTADITSARNLCRDHQAACLVVDGDGCGCQSSSSAVAEDNDRPNGGVVAPKWPQCVVVSGDWSSQLRSKSVQLGATTVMAMASRVAAAKRPNLAVL